MSSLREVKDRIDSVRSTLKITSAMKLVASSKLRKAQRAIEAMRPYQEELEGILNEVLLQKGIQTETFSGQGNILDPNVLDRNSPDRNPQPVILLAISSNSSMCGAFNSNVIKKVTQTIKELSAGGLEVQVWSFGRKMTDALRKNGTPAAREYSTLVARPDFGTVAEIAAELRTLHACGKVTETTMIYNHFVSTGRQQVVAESLFLDGVQSADYESDEELPATGRGYIFEPSRAELVESLMPMVGNLSLYTALLDSAAAEHAARMVAMQAATDNGEQLLAELTLEYNKGRQQKITSEILDLTAGAAV